MGENTRRTFRNFFAKLCYFIEMKKGFTISLRFRFQSDRESKKRLYSVHFTIRGFFALLRKCNNIFSSSIHIAKN